MAGQYAKATTAVMLGVLAATILGCNQEGLFLKEPLLQPVHQVAVPVAIQPVTLTRQDFVRDIEKDRYTAVRTPLEIPWINQERFGELVRQYVTQTELFRDAATYPPSESAEKYLVLHSHVRLKQYVRPSLAGTVLTVGTGFVYNLLGGSSLYRYVECELTVGADTPSGRHINTYFSSCASDEQLVTDSPEHLGPMVSLAFTRALDDVANQMAMDNKLLVRALAPEMTEKGLARPGGPRIGIHSPVDLLVRSRSVRVKGEVTGIDRPVELQWSLNEQDRGKVSLLETATPSRKKFAFDATFEEGDCRLRLTLHERFREADTPAELARMFVPYVCQPKGPRVRERWAVVVGISKYAHSNPDTPFKDLEFAHQDAEGFCDFLTDTGCFAEDHILPLVNEQATYENVRQALFEFLADAHEDDLVVVFFSGHGFVEPRSDEGFLMCHDSKYESMASTAFPMWDLHTAVERFIKARRVVVYADACHAGGLQTGTGVKGAAYNPVHGYFEALGSTHGRLVLTASQKGEPSLESAKFGGGHGAFTWCLIKGLKGEADRDSDSLVTAEEMAAYLPSEVARITQDRQHPGISGKYDRALPLSWVPSPVEPASP